MTEDEYQQTIQPLWTEATQRADTCIDYLVSQPPRKQARFELYALLEWAMTVGAENTEVVLERARRRKLARRPR